MSNNKYVDKTIKLYANSGWKRWFAYIRFWDAPFIEVEKLLPREGIIIDVGCGEGLFSNFLAISSLGRKIIGVDIDKNRLQQARKGLVNTKYVFGDITKKEVNHADAIVMMHVLHHLTSYDQQKVFILNYFKILKRNGILVIVEVEPKFSFKFLLTWFTDHFLVPWLFEKKFYSPIYFRKSSEWRKLLINLGFSCSIISCEEGKPFTHVVISCQKN